MVQEFKKAKVFLYLSLRFFIVLNLDSRKYMYFFEKYIKYNIDLTILLNPYKHWKQFSDLEFDWISLFTLCQNCQVVSY